MFPLVPTHLVSTPFTLALALLTTPHHPMAEKTSTAVGIFLYRRVSVLLLRSASDSSRMVMICGLGDRFFPPKKESHFLRLIFLHSRSRSLTRRHSCRLLGCPEESIINAYTTLPGLHGPASNSIHVAASPFQALHFTQNQQTRRRLGRRDCQDCYSGCNLLCVKIIDNDIPAGILQLEFKELARRCRTTRRPVCDPGRLAVHVASIYRPSHL